MTTALMVSPVTRLAVNAPCEDVPVVFSVPADAPFVVSPRLIELCFQTIGVWGDDMFNLAPSGPARWARGLFVSGGFFEVIGVPPFLGRTFAPVGRTLTIDRHSVEIVGVTPPGFHGLDVGHTFDVALPICTESLLHERSYLDMRHGWWLAARRPRAAACTIRSPPASRPASPTPAPAHLGQTRT